MPATEQTQQKDTHTEEAPQPPDDSVITEENSSAESAAAAASDDESGPKGEPSAGSDDNEPPKQQGKRNRPSERRIKRLSRKLSESEQRNQANERRIAELEQTVGELKTGPSDPGEEPELKDFESPQAYAKAYAAWEKKKSAAAKPAKPATPSQPSPPSTNDTQQRAPSKEAVDTFRTAGQERLGDEFLEAWEDSKSINVNATMGDFLLDSDVGPEIYVHLVNNPDEAQEIYYRSDPAAIKRLEALAAKAKKGELDVGGIQVDASSEEQTTETSGERPSGETDGTPPGGTRAPAPPSSTAERGGSAPKKKPDDMDMDEFANFMQQVEASSNG